MDVTTPCLTAVCRLLAKQSMSVGGELGLLFTLCLLDMAVTSHGWIRRALTIILIAHITFVCNQHHVTLNKIHANACVKSQNLGVKKQKKTTKSGPKKRPGKRAPLIIQTYIEPFFLQA